MNQLAWEACFIEHRLPVPDRGPREGYWGARLLPNRRDPILGWRERKNRLPGLLDIDARGMQHAAPEAKDAAYMWVVGGSTALGAYASSTHATYFHQLIPLMEKKRLPVAITVLAAGAWKSVQELEALRLEFKNFTPRPKAVMFLNGLNDLTVGSNARSLFGQKTETLDGSEWSLLYHEHDYEQRVSLYLKNMRRAREFLKENRTKAIFVLQPAIFEKKFLSEIEQQLLRASLVSHASEEALAQSYEALRRGLISLVQENWASFLDCSRPFGGDWRTYFTDLWHFADPGHLKLAECLATKLVPVFSWLRPHE